MNQEESYLKKSEDLIYPNFNFPMNWDRQKEDKLYEKGIIKYSDLFSAKNLYVLGSLFKFILEEKR